MKILLITGYLHLAEGTIAKGIAKTLTDDEVYFFSIHDLKHNVEEFKELIKNMDVIHWLFNLSNLSHKYYYLFDFIKCASVATVHHVDKDEDYKIIAASECDSIHVVSNEWKSFVKDRTDKPVYLAYLGIDIEKKLKKVLPRKISSNIVYIGLLGFYPGRNNRKRIDVALKVFEDLKRKGFNFVVLAKGGGWSSLVSEFVKKGIEIEVMEYDSSNSQKKFFDRIDIYLCCSDVEGGPYPVLESLANGVPVVSTKVGIAFDALTKGGGILSEKEDSTGLTSNIIKLIENSSEYTKLSNEGYLVSQLFEWHNIKDAYEFMYKNTIEVFNSNKNILNKIDSQYYIDAIKQRKLALVRNSYYEVPNYLEHKSYLKVFKIWGIFLVQTQGISVRRKFSLTNLIFKSLFK